jgi:hypothetical protein
MPAELLVFIAGLLPATTPLEIAPSHRPTSGTGALEQPFGALTSITRYAASHFLRNRRICDMRSGPAAIPPTAPIAHGASVARPTCCIP